jgi:hypothetical protein
MQKNHLPVKTYSGFLLNTRDSYSILGILTRYSRFLLDTRYAYSILGIPTWYSGFVLDTLYVYSILGTRKKETLPFGRYNLCVTLCIRPKVSHLTVTFEPHNLMGYSLNGRVHVYQIWSKSTFQTIAMCDNRLWQPYLCYQKVGGTAQLEIERHICSQPSQRSRKHDFEYFSGQIFRIWFSDFPMIPICIPCSFVPFHLLYIVAFRIWSFIIFTWIAGN